MEFATADETDETEPEPEPLLIINDVSDSGTESFNDSPTTEEAAAVAAATPRPSTPWAPPNCSQRLRFGARSILDRSLSIEDDILVHPLQPEVVRIDFAARTNGNDEKTSPLTSILRRTSFYDSLTEDGSLHPKTKSRQVSFPEHQHVLATYREANLKSPVLPDEPWTADKVLQAYQASCTRHKTIQLDTITNQIIAFKNNIDYTEVFNLSTMNVSMEVCETIEDLLKIANFHTLIIKDCHFTPQSVREFINILDFYNCATEIITSDNYSPDAEVWAMFCAMISKCHRLQSLSFDSFIFSDRQFHVLLNGLKYHDNIRILKLNGCRLSNNLLNRLVRSLEMNMILQELYLPQTGLYTREAELLSRLIAHNHKIKVLDLSNNQIGDRGLDALAKGLCTHTNVSDGLTVLVIYNTQLSDKSGTSLGNIIAGCKSLHTLNIGCNNLTDEVIGKIGDGLKETEVFEGLGLQSTLLTDRGAAQLANAIQNNRSLQKINLKGNKGIQFQGLDSLCYALTNSKVIKLEIDETNRNCDNPDGYMAKVAQINAICTVNKTRIVTAKLDDEAEISNWSLYFLRKISLNCDPIYNLPIIQLSEASSSTATSSLRKKSPTVSPMQSPGCSPTPRSRFSVSRVPESNHAPRSRFTVSPVKLPDFGSGETLDSSSPPPDEDLCVGSQFSNIRSSVSSIESVDSISIKDSVYDSATPSCESD